MDQLALSRLTLGLHVWYLTPPFLEMALPPIAHYELILVQQVTTSTVSTKTSLSMNQPPPLATTLQNRCVIKSNPTTHTNRGIKQPKLKAPITTNHALESSTRTTKPNMKGSTQQTIKEPIMHDTLTMWVTPLCYMDDKAMQPIYALPYLSS